MSVTTPKIYLTRNIDGLEYVLKSIHEEYVKTGDRNIEDLLGDCEELEEYQYKEIEAYLIIIEKMIGGRL